MNSRCNLHTFINWALRNHEQAIATGYVEKAVSRVYENQIPSIHQDYRKFDIVKTNIQRNSNRHAQGYFRSTHVKTAPLALTSLTRNVIGQLIGALEVCWRRQEILLARKCTCELTRLIKFDCVVVSRVSQFFLKEIAHSSILNMASSSSSTRYRR
jgi:hypothetical protein